MKAHAFFNDLDFGSLRSLSPPVKINNVDLTHSIGFSAKSSNMVTAHNSSIVHETSDGELSEININNFSFSKIKSTDNSPTKKKFVNSLFSNANSYANSPILALKKSDNNLNFLTRGISDFSYDSFIDPNVNVQDIIIDDYMSIPRHTTIRETAEETEYDHSVLKVFESSLLEKVSWLKNKDTKLILFSDGKIECWNPIKHKLKNVLNLKKNSRVKIYEKECFGLKIDGESYKFKVKIILIYFLFLGNRKRL